MATEQQGGGAVTSSSTVNNGGTAINVGTSTILDNRNVGSYTKTVLHQHLSTMIVQTRLFLLVLLHLTIKLDLS